MVMVIVMLMVMKVEHKPVTVILRQIAKPVLRTYWRVDGDSDDGDMIVMVVIMMIMMISA